MASQKETLSYAAFTQLLDTLRQVADEHLAPEQGVTDEIDIAEGFRNILHLLSAATDFYLEGDPERPEFVKIVSPTRRIMGDNPDAIYHMARIRGDRSYRVTGVKGDECYLSFTIHGRTEDGKLGAAAEPVLADFNDRDMKVAQDGTFELILSPHEHPGNGIKLAPNAASVITRHYFELEGSPAAEPDRRVQLRIEPLEEQPQRPPISDQAMARKLADVSAFVRGCTLESGTDRPEQPPFVSTIPNEVGPPTIFRMAGSSSWGAVDIAYSMGPFCLEESEALLMEGTFPGCAFASVVLWNRFMQCFEFRDRRISLNRKQTVLEPDGSFRIVIAHRDPGVPNWLDTEGHREGTIFWRFLLPEQTPEKPRCTVLPLAELVR
jgi:hypothetical protein